MSVKIKDREKEIECFRIALTLSEISIDYETADLVYKVFEAYKNKGDKFSVKDAVELKSKHEKYWFDYHKPKSKLEFEEESK